MSGRCPRGRAWRTSRLLEPLWEPKTMPKTPQNAPFSAAAAAAPAPQELAAVHHAHLLAVRVPGGAHVLQEAVALQQPAESAVVPVQPGRGRQGQQVAWRRPPTRAVAPASGLRDTESMPSSWCARPLPVSATGSPRSPPPSQAVLAVTARRRSRKRPAAQSSKSRAVAFGPAWRGLRREARSAK